MNIKKINKAILELASSTLGFKSILYVPGSKIITSEFFNEFWHTIITHGEFKRVKSLISLNSKPLSAICYNVDNLSVPVKFFEKAIINVESSKSILFNKTGTIAVLMEI